MQKSSTNDVLLVVWMVTYNHESFLSQAIESVLVQKTNFRFKLFIGEDFSTDQTRQICLDFKNKNPDKIELFLHNSNLGNFKNGIFMYERCFESSAKYIALLEGDDYWSDENKLQKQVDYLESNPAYTFCGHSFKILNAETKTLIQTRMVMGNPVKLKNALLGTPFHTSTIIFRNGFGFPNNFATAGVGDFHLQCHLASKGYGYGFPEPMSVYRISKNGVWSRESELKQYFTTLRLQLWAINQFKKHLFLQTKRIQELFNHLQSNNCMIEEKLTTSEITTLNYSLKLFQIFQFRQKVKEKFFLTMKKFFYSKSFIFGL